VRPQFGDLPDDAKNLMTNMTGIDFTPWDMKAPRWFSAWTRDERGFIAGIFSIEFKHSWEGYVNVVVLDQRCITRQALRAIFTAAFSQAVRLTAEIEPENRRALRQVQRMGFVYEGYRRLGLEGSRDTMVYGMLRDDCKYLPGYKGPTVLATPTLPEYVYERVH
jgi:RimJ/RimL family protein N-acetyltransferase